MRRIERALVTASLLAAWTAASLHADFVPASIQVAKCDLPANAPARWVLSPEDLPIEPTPLAEPPPFPSAGSVGQGVYLETALLLVASVVLLWLAVRRGKVAKARRTPKASGAFYASATPPSRGLLFLRLAAGFFLVLFADHAFRASSTTLSLRKAEDHVRQSRYAEAGAALQRVEGLRKTSLIGFLTPGFDTSLEKVDVGRLREINGIYAVRQGLGTSLEEAEQGLALFEPVSPAGVAAVYAVESRRAQAFLEGGDPENAFKSALRGSALGSLSPAVTSNLCAARYHYALDLTEKGRPQEALTLAKALEPPACHLGTEDRVVLRGVIARKEAELYLTGQRAKTAEAVAAEARAYGFMTDLGLNVPFVTCDYAAALEPHALALLAEDRPADSVAALEKTDALVPGREFVRVLMPKALWSLGTRHLSEQRYDEAIAALERGYALPEGRSDKDILDMLTLAHFSKGSRSFEEGELDTAVEAMTRAHDLKGKDRAITLALADAHLARADESLRVGERPAAVADAESAGRLTPQRRAQAEMRRSIAAGTPARLQRFERSSEFLRVPSFVGEVPKDVNDDGIADGVIYYGSDREKPAAVGYLSPRTGMPETVLLLDDESQVVGALRDNDRDGELDERIDYQGDRLAKLVIDSDRDRSPDVLIQYNDEAEMVRQYLSGRVLMRFKSGVVGAVVDPLNDADAYVKLFRNSQFVQRTETVIDTNFPSWRRGLTLDYTAGDVIGLEVWDEDVFFDDLIDWGEYYEYPTSGIIRLKKGIVALEIDVEPTDLPEGHVIWDEAPSTSNIFRDNPMAVPEAADLVAGAHRARETVALNRWVTRQLVMYLLVPRLIPFENEVLRFLSEIVIEYTVVDPLLPE